MYCPPNTFSHRPHHILYICYLVGQAFLFPVDRSLYLLLSAVVSELFYFAIIFTFVASSNLLQRW